MTDDATTHEELPPFKGHTTAEHRIRFSGNIAVPAGGVACTGSGTGCLHQAMARLSRRDRPARVTAVVTGNVTTPPAL